MAEETLAGGNTVGAVRSGEVVHKRASPWTPTVHALLRYLEDAGFEGAPRALGFDGRGREMVSYLPGDTAAGRFPWPGWTFTDTLLPVAGYLDDSAAHVATLPDAFWSPRRRGEAG